MEKLKPIDISSSFAAHIKAESGKVKPVQPCTIETATFRDWCVDRFHSTTNSPEGTKTASEGGVLAGAGVARALGDIPQLESPYQFIQRAVQESNNGVVKVIFQAHENCGYIAVNHEAVTPEEQEAVIALAWAIWNQAYKNLQSLSPSDGKRVTLERSIGNRGSAPTIRKAGMKYFIANPDYLKHIQQIFPLNPDFVDRLIPSQRNLAIKPKP